MSTNKPIAYVFTGNKMCKLILLIVISISIADYVFELNYIFHKNEIDSKYRNLIGKQVIWNRISINILSVDEHHYKCCFFSYNIPYELTFDREWLFNYYIDNKE